MLNRPNFFIVGAAKSGTSALSDFLSQHEEIVFSSIKEPFFFIDDPRVKNESEYLKLFSSRDKKVAVGEGSTGYLFSEKSPNLIKKFCPSAKIIIMLRNPIDMAFSLWKYMCVHGNETMDFQDALRDRVDRTEELFKKSCAGRSENYLYIDRASYFDQVKRFIDIFGENNIKIIVFERFIENPNEICSDVFKFLGVSSDFKPKFRVVNPSGEIRFQWLKRLKNRKYPLLKKIIPINLRYRVREAVRDFNVNKKGKVTLPFYIRKEVGAYFSDDVGKLKKFLSDDLTEWKDF